MTAAIADSGAANSSPARAGSPNAARKQAGASAISLLPAFVERLRWGNTNGAAELVEQMAGALEISYPGVAAKMRRYQTLKPVEMKLPQDILSFEEPAMRFADVVLPADIEAQLPEILKEHRRADDLARYHLSPRHRILVEGPPGNGKTMLAEAFAGELGVPLLRVNYAGLIESHLGETGKNLSKAFRYAECAPCVLFLDEFDSIGSSRTSSDLGEMKRISNQLLLLIDRLPAHCVLICATNLGDLIDPALLRRFDFCLHIPVPDRDRRQRCAAKELSPSLTPGHDVSRLAGLLAEQAFPNLASLVRRCRAIRRDLVLNTGINVEQLAGQPAE